MPYKVENCLNKSTSTLADFQRELIGCWENQDYGKDAAGKPVGGPENPLSYNIMPLPSVPPCPEKQVNCSDPEENGFILKNFRYSERLRFNDCDDKNTLAIAATAPNRGGLIGQNCRVVFYEQQVRFAEGPAGPDNPNGAQVVHVENGAWLYLPRYVQQSGPYPANIDDEPVTEDLEQPADIKIAKQMAIPHGNTIHALGHFDTITQATAAGSSVTSSAYITGSPTIPDGVMPYPTPVQPLCNRGNGQVPPAPSLVSNLNAFKRYSETDPYLNDPHFKACSGKYGYQNPHPEYTRFPNLPLQQAVAIIKPDQYMHWRVSTRESSDGHGRGGVMNIPFEERVSDVIEYTAEYWLLFKGSNKYLAYTQTIPMVFTINGVKYVFPHVTCNVVTFCVNQ